MPKAEQPVIRKVVRKGGHGHHGGSWKVAYADFVTAMMAFFLLMWLLNSVSPQKLAKISDYFNDHNIFDPASDKPALQEGGGSIIERQSPSPPPPLGEVRESSEIRQKLDPPPGQTPAPQALHAELTGLLRRKLADMQDQVLLDVTQEGVRVQITSPDGNPIFDSGGDRMTLAGQRALEALAESLRGLSARLAIEGHTDARPFSGFGGRDNWDLSAERALAAKRALVARGIGPERIARVQGMAALQPLLPTDPADERNRRISILIIAEKPGKAAWEPGKDVGEPREPAQTRLSDPQSLDRLYPALVPGASPAVSPDAVRNATQGPAQSPAQGR